MANISAKIKATLRSWVAFDYEPLKLSPDQPLAHKLEALQSRIRKDWPGVALPPIYVLHSVPKVSLLDYGASMVAAFYMSKDMPTLPQGIYVSAPHFRTFSDEQLLTMITHEYGHHFLRHLPYAFSRDMTDEEKLAQKRVTECEADQFAGHYVTGASQHLETMIRRVRGGELLETPQPDDGHPADMDRIVALRNQAVQAVPPGMLSFSPRCEPYLPTIEKTPANLLPDYSRLEQFSPPPGPYQPMPEPTGHLHR